MASESRRKGGLRPSPFRGSRRIKKRLGQLVIFLVAVSGLSSLHMLSGFWFGDR